jgi:hypothetical protein
MPATAVARRNAYTEDEHICQANHAWTARVICPPSASISVRDPGLRLVLTKQKITLQAA